MTSLMTKENIILALVMFIALVVGIPMIGSEATEALGSSTCNNGNCTDFDAVDVTAGYYVDGVSVINGSGQISTANAATVGTFTQGGGVTATTSSTTSTFIATDFDVESLVEVTPANGSSVNTLMASTTFPLSTTAGSMRSIAFYNATGTAGITVTIASATGVRVVASTTATTTPAVLAPKAMAVFTAVRLSNSDIVVTKAP